MENVKYESAMVRVIVLMLEHGLGDWKLKFNNKRSVLAETYYKRRTIMFSRSFVLVATREQIEGVAYHEIAHALLGHGKGHGVEFKKLCAEISPNSDYAQRSVDIGIRRMKTECPRCGAVSTTNRKKPGYCTPCWKERKEQVVVIKTENELKLTPW